MSDQLLPEKCGKSLPELRQEIDTIDEEIVNLISKRADVARQVGLLKSTDNGIAFVPTRERVVLNHVESVNKGLLPNDAIRAIFQQIIAANRNLEQPVSVAYLGPPFTFSHYAAQLRFGATSNLIEADSISDVIDMVEHGKAHYGVVPIENSTEGVIRETLDAMYRCTLSIADELNIPVRHSLWGRSELKDIKEIYSHPQPLAQCRNWLHRTLPGVLLQTASSTSKAAEIVAGRPECAAICQPMAAEQFNLNLLADRIEDSPYNRTRFYVIGQAKSQPSGRDKTSVVFSVKHTAGSLNHALRVLENHGINLTLIESRPTKEMPWQYLFYIDFQGHIDDPRIVAALDEMREHCLFVRIFGSYPEGN